MKRTWLLLSVVALFATVLVCYAADVQLGTWKLNEAKSKVTAGGQRNTTVIMEAAGDSVKVIAEGVDGNGKPSRNEWTGKYDGKDYPVTGDPTSDMRSYKQVDDHTLAVVVKKSGKTTLTGNIVVSADGKTRTLTIEGTDATGKKINSILVYDKQ